MINPMFIHFQNIFVLYFQNLNIGLTKKDNPDKN